MTKLNSTNFIDNQEMLVRFEKSYLNSNLQNSTIIYGDKGIGKSTFVKFLVIKIFTNFSEDKLNISKHSSQILNNSHPNFRIISKLIDEKTKKTKTDITINQIRNLESFIYQSSLVDLPKIILIDSADDLNISSSNALLKRLEEPKKNTYFFLISHQPSLLLPTIRSRCIKFKFKKPSYKIFKKILLFNNENLIDDDLIEYLFYLSNGSPGISQELYSNDILDIFENFLQICIENKVLSNKIIEFSSKLSHLNNEQFSTFLIIIKFVLSNVLKINLGIDIKKNTSYKLTMKLIDISKYLNNSSCFKTLDYLRDYENKLFTFNLDKKIFTINLFSHIASN